MFLSRCICLFVFFWTSLCFFVKMCARALSMVLSMVLKYALRHSVISSSLVCTILYVAQIVESVSALANTNINLLDAAE